MMIPKPQAGESYIHFVARASDALATSVPDAGKRRGAVDLEWLLSNTTGLVRNNGELVLHGPIGFQEYGTDSTTVMRDLDSLDLQDGSTLTVRINSPGGIVFEGLAIYNLLAEKRRQGVAIVVRVDGIAASMGSIIAMIGDRVIMPRNTQMLIHNPAGLAFGDAEFLRSEVKNLENIENAMIGIYARKSGLAEAKIREMMARETFMSAEEAKKNGFADQVEDEDVTSEAVAKYRATAPIALASKSAIQTGEATMAEAETQNPKPATAAQAAPAVDTQPGPAAAQPQAAQPSAPAEPAQPVIAPAQSQATTATGDFDAGAKAERDRVTAIVSAGWTARYPDLQRQALAEGWSLEQLALKAHEQAATTEAPTDPTAAKRQAIASARQADAEAAVPPAATDEQQTQANPDNLPLEQKAERDWDKKPDLREEFGGNKDAYVAFLKAKESGQVRIRNK